MNKYSDYIYYLLRSNAVATREEAISKTIDVFCITDEFEKALLTWSVI